MHITRESIIKTLLWNPSSDPDNPNHAFFENIIPFLNQLAQLYVIYLVCPVSSTQEKEQVLTLLRNAQQFNNNVIDERRVLFCETEEGKIHIIRHLETNVHVEGGTNGEECVEMVRGFVGNVIWLLHGDNNRNGTLTENNEIKSNIDRSQWTNVEACPERIHTPLTNQTDLCVLSIMSNGQPQSCFQKLNRINEETWLQMGTAAELMQEYDRAMNAYESALRHNSYSIPALSSIAALCRGREQFPKAVEYFQRILNIDQTNGEIWGALGHCYLMMDDLQKAYSAYQQALFHLPNPKEPKLWYGIGILYDRYGSLDHAEEAFSQVMRMEPKFEKANEIYFRLGIIYKQQQKYDQSLECFKYILHNPPRPLTEVDIWFQIGHVYEQQKNFISAKEAYERVLNDNPNHAKVLQQLGWLYHQQSASFTNQDLAITYLTKSLESDGTDAQSWYLLGRCYMAQQKYNKAYEAYQQAVYRDGRNPTFWCSIGVLYYQINQFRDALDAYSRAIRLNPYISEVWYDLGTLYESCNNQINDALDAYQRAAELDPSNPHIKQRLQMLRSQQAGGQTSAPIPQDVNPQAYQSSNGPPTMLGGNTPTFAQPTPGPPGPPGMPGYGGRPVDSRSSHTPVPISLSSIHGHGEGSHRDLPPMNRRSPGPNTYTPPPPPHLRDRPPTPPNQPHPLNPRTSPSPQLPQIQMQDDRHPRHSPQLTEPYQSLRPNFPSSPRMMTDHDPDIYDKVSKSDERPSNGVSTYHPSESLNSSHDPLPPINYNENRDNLEPIMKRSDEQPLRQTDHTRVPPISSSHRTHPIEHNEHNRIQDEVPLEEKGIPPYPYHSEEQHHSRRPTDIKSESPIVQRTPLSESPVRDSYPNEQHSPISNVSNNDIPRKSSSDQRPETPRMELSKIPLDNDKSILPPMRSNSSNNERSSGSTTTRAVDEDYDGTTSTAETLASLRDPDVQSSAAQKRSYSPSKGDEDDRRDESNAKRIKPSPTSPPTADAPSPISSHSERERERDRRKSEQSANGSSTSPSATTP
ncbi:46202_t:CDS:10 [Gigaspora margarita]|uniref:46202_t:CDS:1 n=1 Tax=Gigaspora margarita TaxID=4874 RepID=A0ABN7UFB5_GIGMA|nr:46202_t:CDS:10 [Gigaspora margarita]